MKKKSLILMSLAAIVIFAGCSEKKTKKAKADLDDETEEIVSHGNRKRVDGEGKDIFSKFGGMSPKEVAVKWYKAVSEGDVKTANKYSTENTHAFNALIAAALESEKKSDKDKDDINETIDKLKSAEEKIDGDTATLVVDGKEGLTLKKVDGEWKVDMKK